MTDCTSKQIQFGRASGRNPVGQLLHQRVFGIACGHEDLNDVLVNLLRTFGLKGT